MHHHAALIKGLLDVASEDIEATHLNKEIKTHISLGRLASPKLAELERRRGRKEALREAGLGRYVADRVNGRRMPGAGEPLAHELYGALTRTRDPELTCDLPLPVRPSKEGRIGLDQAAFSQLSGGYRQRRRAVQRRAL